MEERNGKITMSNKEAIGAMALGGAAILASSSFAGWRDGSIAKSEGYRTGYDDAVSEMTESGLQAATIEEIETTLAGFITLEENGYLLSGCKEQGEGEYRKVCVKFVTIHG